ncbi:hypothetical protein pdam_00003078 [Pocillopora damicornis]|uniref:Uncharacterized protein n=1 Tax=Pocillopora damicornis TaxID=46731 RepID=A0A3M6T9P7_POCDA|nr:hypothetical protein pdam_00003078 [Pocillopora damicornis]
MVDAEGKHQERMNINEGKVQRAEETKRSKTEHSLFPRVCGYHSWVVCGRRRRSSSGKKRGKEASFNLQDVFEDF